MKPVLVVAVTIATAAALPAGAGYLDSAGNARLKGRIGAVLDRMIRNHVEATDIDYITDCFREKTERKGCWQTEFWGKYMHAAVPLAAYSGSAVLAANIDRGLGNVLASQEPNGYIGNYPDDIRLDGGWDVWGIKYTMLGLLHYYDSKGESGRRALEACGRLCDYVIAEIGPGGKRGRELWTTGSWSGYASSSILEPVMLLYKRTHEKRYLDFAEYVVKGMEEPESGPRLVDLALKGIHVADRNGHGNLPEKDSRRYVSKHNRWKAYEMMSCYQGLVEYWEVKSAAGDATAAKYLKAAVMAGEDIAKTEVNLAGGCSASEAWFHGAVKQHLPVYRPQETCVTTTWMRFCEKLLDVTGEPKWADEIEKSFYNIYLAAFKPDGTTFSAYVPLSGSRYYGHDHCFMHHNCCNANGPRGVLCFLREFFTTGRDSATINFYTSALLDAKLGDGRRVAFDMYSVYPREEKARIVSHTAGVGVVPLRLRIPAWSAKTSVRLNGKELGGVKAGSYFEISHEWKLGDVIEIAFDMPVVTHLADFDRDGRPHHAAFTRGPVLLARDSRFADGDLTEAFRRFILKDGGRMPSFTPVMTGRDDIWMTFSATLPIGGHAENPEGRLPSTVFFCDYASAGNGWRRGEYYRTWFPIEYGPEE